MTIRERTVADYLDRLDRVADATEVRITLAAQQASRLQEHFATYQRSRLEISLALAKAIKQRPAIRKVTISGPGIEDLYVDAGAP